MPQKAVRIGLELILCHRVQRAGGHEWLSGVKIMVYMLHAYLQPSFGVCLDRCLRAICGSLPEWYEGMDLVTAVAGLFHHLPHEGPPLDRSTSVINVLSADELFQTEIMVDGVRVIRQSFKRRRSGEESEEWTLREVDPDRLVLLGAPGGLDLAHHLRTWSAPI
ncbi:hypothetical protein AXG93_1390s1070 [Marchantia polymorpha subsp. ruderalis]|uniref:Uncharacterized protein n=1 Tax=Marchantia polymorpha subsp. ruderalis TaxID=1480154 RepID=A0A176W7Z7_MARPO|nr:hypothetical protein AXG93_1390s1070 [Marchantia polymorpha subsp. ruderalis]